MTIADTISSPVAVYHQYSVHATYRVDCIPTLAISVSLSTAAARIGPTRVVTVSLMAAAYLWVYSYMYMHMWLLAAGCNQVLTARLTGFRCCTW